MNKDDTYWMGKAIDQARRAEAIGEVPIGAVIVKDGAIIARGSTSASRPCEPDSAARTRSMTACAEAVYSLNELLDADKVDLPRVAQLFDRFEGGRYRMRRALTH